MAFVISKTSTRKGKPKKLYYLVKNIREGKKINRKTLLNLYEYSTLADFINYLEQEEIQWSNKLMKYEKELAEPGDSPSFLVGTIKYVKSRLEEYRLKIQETKQYI